MEALEDKKEITEGDRKLISVWNYLWNTYSYRGLLPSDISQAIDLIRERLY